MIRGKWERAQTPWNWKNFTREFNEKFLPPLIQEKREDEFIKLRQGTLSVAEYEGKFTKFSKYAPELVTNERKRIMCFVQGLNVEIWEGLAAAQISTFTEVLEKAQRVESAGEKPYKHLQEFDVVCNSMKPPEIIEEQIKMRTFPFSLKDSAKDWLDRSIIDAASGGALVNKTPREAWELIEGMAENSQQFGTREDISICKVNEIETSSIQQQLTELTLFVRQLAVGNASQAKVCGICTGMGHSTDMCPMIQEENVEQVNMAGYTPAPRNQYDPYSNTYNPGWRDHPNLSYGGNRQSNFIPNRQQGYQQQYQPRPPPPPSSSPSLEEMMKQFIATTAQRQQKTDSEIQDIRSQISQMAISINRLESQVNRRLPSQPELNLKNVSAMTLRSGKKIQGPELVTPKDKDEEKIEKELEAENTSIKNPAVLPDPIIDVKTNPPLFSSRLEKPKKQDQEKEILEVLRKIEINIPLLDAIKQVPKYVKFLRDLCVNQRRLRGDERVIVGENMSAILQRCQVGLLSHVG
ncbi:uncharacterized protein LOC113751499 [Coffea eugenioides]|uniref:uncharacterized protein LOC113751499 n=1 Tax=Coffea eugenioides TaxID=49369 RepID=UPI000F60F566|nr:uncharacterized protein LOC113751499 [Coffea eugenioides]